MSRYVSLLAGQLENPDPGTTHRRATAIFALMVGTLEFARAVTDTSRVEKILDGGIEAALVLANAQFA